MKEFFAFAGEHPIVTMVILYVAIHCSYGVLIYPMTLANRVIRHLNIRKCGWPPEHLDGDGDFRPKS